MVDSAALFRDLTAEGDDLERLVAPLDETGWRLPTPAPGWSVAHQIAHLTWTDGAAFAALTDPARFDAEYVAPAASASAVGGSLIDEAAEVGARASAAELLARWRDGRARLLEALTLRSAQGGAAVPWFGTPMSVASTATARLMETWAHGQDVADALGVRRAPTARLRHVAHLGVRTRDFAFRTRGLTPPPEPFRVELTAPDGDLWAWGPDDAAQRVTGPAEDFCLLVTQRRALPDLAVSADGADARRWLAIAQAFAGPPGAGRSSTRPQARATP